MWKNLVPEIEVESGLVDSVQLPAMPNRKAKRKVKAELRQTKRRLERAYARLVKKTVKGQLGEPAILVKVEK